MSRRQSLYKRHDLIAAKTSQVTPTSFHDTPLTGSIPLTDTSGLDDDNSGKEDASICASVF